MTEASTIAKKPVFVRKAEVTVPQLKINKNEEYYVKFAGPIHLGANMPDRVEVDAKTGEVTKTAVKPAQVAYVVDLVTNSPRQIVLSSVMVSELERSYPNDAYVGKCFGFRDLGKLNGKQYNSIEIWEIEEPEGVFEMKVAGGIGPAAKVATKEEAIDHANAEVEKAVEQAKQGGKKK